jgi:hypothetical protein
MNEAATFVDGELAMIPAPKSHEVTEEQTLNAENYDSKVKRCKYNHIFNLIK